MEGLSYGSPGNELALASFYFGPSANRTKYYEYTMTLDPGDSNVWNFGFSQFVPGVTIPSDVYPLVQNISYQMANQTFSATCTTGPEANGTTSCMQGSFDEGGYLSLNINNTLANVVTNLRAVDKNWMFVPADDAPSYILAEVEPDGSLGQSQLRTAVTFPGHCTILKLCSETGIDVLPPVGLTLMRQNAYSIVCTTPNSN